LTIKTILRFTFGEKYGKTERQYTENGAGIFEGTGIDRASLGQRHDNRVRERERQTKIEAGIERERERQTKLEAGIETEKIFVCHLLNFACIHMQVFCIQTHSHAYARKHECSHILTFARAQTNQA
jgi:hypothetical protein